MKTLALALLVPVAFCTACDRKEEPVEAMATAPAPINEAANAPATGATPEPEPATATENAPRTAYASLTAAPGSEVKGGFMLIHQGSAVSIRGEITGLAPGREYGFHVHEFGECALPDFASAGGHFNPTKDPHGGPESTPRHLGDLPNAKADESGRATVFINAEGLTLVDKDGAPTQVLGKALVVHARPDDHKTQPAGDSGDRIACGVIG